MKIRSRHPRRELPPFGLWRYLIGIISFKLKKIKVTVCELSNEPKYFEKDWQALVAHMKSEGSNLVLLPEMTFSPWAA
jgi:hypothetical protein